MNPPGPDPAPGHGFAGRLTARFINSKLTPIAVIASRNPPSPASASARSFARCASAIATACLQNWRFTPIGHVHSYATPSSRSWNFSTLLLALSGSAS